MPKLMKMQMQMQALPGTRKNSIFTLFSYFITRFFMMIILFNVVDSKIILRKLEIRVVLKNLLLFLRLVRLLEV